MTIETALAKASMSQPCDRARSEQDLSQDDGWRDVADADAELFVGRCISSKLAAPAAAATLNVGAAGVFSRR